MMSDVVACVGIPVAVYRLFPHVTRGMNDKLFDLKKDLLWLPHQGGHRLFLDKIRRARQEQWLFLRMIKVVLFIVLSDSMM
jgi:hypothetical protein